MRAVPLSTLSPLHLPLLFVVCGVCVRVWEFFPLQFFLASTKPPTWVHVLVPPALSPSHDPVLAECLESALPACKRPERVCPASQAASYPARGQVIKSVVLLSLWIGRTGGGWVRCGCCEVPFRFCGKCQLDGAPCKNKKKKTLKKRLLFSSVWFGSAQINYHKNTAYIRMHNWRQKNMRKSMHDTLRPPIPVPLTVPLSRCQVPSEHVMRQTHTHPTLAVSVYVCVCAICSANYWEMSRKFWAETEKRKKQQ